MLAALTGWLGIAAAQSPPALEAGIPQAPLQLLLVARDPRGLSSSFVEERSIQKAGAITTLWILTAFRMDRPFQDGPSAPKLTSIGYWAKYEVDCAAKKLRQVELAMVGPDGKVIGRAPETGEMHPFVLGQSEHGAGEAACATPAADTPRFDAIAAAVQHVRTASGQ